MVGERADRFDLDPRSKPVDDIKGRAEGEKDKAGFALPGPLIYERVTNLKIP